MNENEDEQKESEEEKTTSRKRSPLKQPLPDARITKLENIIDTIKAYDELSSRGTKALKYSDFKGYVNFSIQYVSGLNKFLEYLGLVERVTGQQGHYKPSQELINYSERVEWKQDDEAKKIMANIFNKTWFFESARKAIKLRKDVTQQDLIQILGIDSGATQQHKTSLKIVIELLVYANLIYEQDGKYFLMDEGGVPIKEEETPREEVTTLHQEEPSEPKYIPKVTTKQITAPITINLNIDADMSEEKIDLIFEKIKQLYKSQE